MVREEIRGLGKEGKDMGGGGVVIYGVMRVVIGVMILIGKIVEVLG